MEEGEGREETFSLSAEQEARGEIKSKGGTRKGNSGGSLGYFETTP